MKRDLILCVLFTALVVGCGSSHPAKPGVTVTPNQGANPAPTQVTGVTWSDADKSTYLKNCGLGSEKACDCAVQILQSQGVTFAQYEQDPSLDGNAIASPQMGTCLQN